MFWSYALMYPSFHTNYLTLQALGNCLLQIQFSRNWNLRITYINFIDLQFYKFLPVSSSKSSFLPTLFYSCHCIHQDARCLAPSPNTLIMLIMFSCLSLSFTIKNSFVSLDPVDHLLWLILHQTVFFFFLIFLDVIRTNISSGSFLYPLNHSTVRTFFLYLGAYKKGSSLP